VLSSVGLRRFLRFVDRNLKVIDIFNTFYNPEKKSAIKSTNIVNIFVKDRDKPAFFYLIYPKKVQPILEAFFMKFPLFFGKFRGIFQETKFLRKYNFLNFLSAEIIWDIGKFPGSFFLAILAV